MKRTFSFFLLMGLLVAGCAWDNEDDNGDWSSDLIPNGEACTSNEQCESGNCFGGKVCRTPGWVEPTSLTPNGEACTSNEECESGNCFGGKVCRTQGWVEPDSCQKNADCGTKLCVNGKCSNVTDSKIADPFTGLGSKTVGTACSESSECESGLCVNQLCSEDCESTGCDLGYYVCRHNKCIPVGTEGNECIERADCSLGEYCCNGFCKAGGCEPGVPCTYENVTCASSCKSTDWGNLCGCSYDEQCGSTHYCGNGFCYPKKNVGETCNYNKECKTWKCSGVCN